MKSFEFDFVCQVELELFGDFCEVVKVEVDFWG